MVAFGTFVARRVGVGRGGGGEVAAQLVQVGTDGVPAVPVADHVAQPVGLAQPGGGTEDVVNCDRGPARRPGPGAPGRR